jgi:hypothetical protein
VSFVFVGEVFFLCCMFLVVFISVSFALLVIGYVCNRFSRQLIPYSLCSYGRQELLFTLISVCVDFLYNKNFKFLSLQCIVRFKD